jgi:mRNA-degrading endonuclease RelE of RelBE toxin-antitoxin system
MTYNLEFKESALKEWRKLDSSIREQFKKKLAERIENPRIESSKLSGMPDCYKIKLKVRSSPFCAPPGPLRSMLALGTIGAPAH